MISESDVTVHALWNQDLESAGHDIALIRLPSLAQTASEDFRLRVAPICLSPHPPRTHMEVVGWGRSNRPDSVTGTFSKFGFYERILQKLSVPELSVGECELQYQRPLWPAYVCAGGVPGQDSCNGDSGGPLVGRYETEGTMYLSGVVSFGTPTCGIGFPGVYTNLEEYLPWIKTHLKAE